MSTIGSFKDIANDFLSFVEGKIIILENLKTICCDQTIFDIDWQSDVIIELKEAI